MMSTRVGLTAVLIGAVLGGATIFGLDYTRVKGQLQDARSANAKLQAQLDHAAEAARLKDAEFGRAMENLKNDLRRKNNLFESQRASNDVATDSLLNHIADLNARLKDAGADSARAAAARNGELLGDCAKRYRDVAAEAERLRLKVEGLQSATRACRAHLSVAE